MTNKTEYDRFAKQFWVKVYQEQLIQSNDHEEAKYYADLAVANYMNSIHRDDSDVKKNFTTDTNVQNMHNMHDRKYNGKPLQPLIDGKPASEISKDQFEIDNLRMRAERAEQDYKTALDEIKILKDKSIGVTNMIEVPFKLNSLNNQGCIRYLTEDRISVLYMHDFCHLSGINQTRIKRILLEMKSEDK